MDTSLIMLGVYIPLHGFQALSFIAFDHVYTHHISCLSVLVNPPSARCTTKSLRTLLVTHLQLTRVLAVSIIRCGCFGAMSRFFSEWIQAICELIRQYTRRSQQHLLHGLLDLCILKSVLGILMHNPLVAVVDFYV
jgi:hypothetical protein